MQARLHVSGEGVASQRFFFKILFCLHRFRSLATQLNAYQVGVIRSDPLSRSQRKRAAIDLPHEGGGEEPSTRVK